jgi:hypothetical protein
MTAGHIVLTTACCGTCSSSDGLTTFTPAGTLKPAGAGMRVFFLIIAASVIGCAAPELKMFCELQDIESNNYSVDDISQMHFERLKRMEVDKIQSLDKDCLAKIVTQFYPNFHSINAHLDRYVV